MNNLINKFWHIFHTPKNKTFSCLNPLILETMEKRILLDGMGLTHEWTLTFANYSSDDTFLNNSNMGDVQIDSMGNIYIAGTFKNSVDLDPTSGIDIRNFSGDLDIFFTKLNSDFTYAWTHTFETETLFSTLFIE